MAKVKGADKIAKNLKRKIKDIDGDLFAGLQAAAKFVEGESNENVPVKFGVLINSSFSGVKKLRNRILARIGYTAKYAEFVHEMPDTNSFTKQGTGPKFLENATKDNSVTIVKIVQRFAKF